ncbi:hypothetical protein FZI94_08330 [Mycobacterium sp. CBMA226]|nr:hypothetical protein [Mycolicibacterium sp. CBMA 226]
MSFLRPIPPRRVVHGLRQMLTHTTILTLALGPAYTGSGKPRGSCDTPVVLCDSRERALPGWLGFA